MRQKRRHYHQGFRCLRRGIQKYWIPLLLGIVATIAVLAVWQQLLVQQQLHIQRSVQQEADAVEAILNRALSARIVALQQMANRWHISGGTKQSLWEADAAKYTQDYYGYQAIEWVDPSLHVRWIVPFQGNEAAQNLDLNQEPRRKLTLTIARDLHQTLLTRAVLLAQGGQGFLVCVPLFVEGQDGGLTINQFDGFILGVFRFQSLFDSILKPSSPYQIRIYDNKQLVYSQGDASPSALSQTAVVKAYGADWRIQVSPTPEFIAGERSPLPTLVLWGGLFGAWTLALTVYLGQRSERHVRRAKKINQQLQNEIIHRQSVEGSLRESEERLQLALEASGEGWWDWDIGTGKVDRSPQYLQLLGYEVGDFPEAFNVWETAIHPDDLPHVLEQLNTHLKDASVPYACDYRVRTRSGDWQWIADYGKVVVRDAQNQPLRMIGTFKDIGDRKHMESALRESEERWQLALRGNNDGIWDWNVRTNEVFFSSRLKEMLGFADHEMANHLNEWTNRIHPDDLDWVMAAVQDHFTKKTPFYATEHRVQCKDGTYKWILDRGQAIWDDAGNVIRMTGSHTDITERKQAEAALRKSEEALRQSEATKQAIIQAIPDLLIRMRADGRYVEFISNSQFNIVNPNHHRQDTRVHDVLPSDLARLRMHYIQQALQSGETQVYEHEILIHEKHCYEEVRIVPLPHEEVLIMVRDITARKQAEDDLRHQKQMFQAIVNHIPVMIALYNAEGRIEFINPELERVLGWTLADWQQQDILAHTYPDPIDRQSAIEHMLAATGHWKDFSTLTADQQLLETSWVNVSLSRGLLLGIGQDVSDRKQKERALRQAMEAAEAANL
ncbi:MAG TPA: PAS domain-containing protein, partial [Crinalium sp.]